MSDHISLGDCLRRQIARRETLTLRFHRREYGQETIVVIDLRHPIFSHGSAVIVIARSLLSKSIRCRRTRVALQRPDLHGKYGQQIFAQLAIGLLRGRIPSRNHAGHPGGLNQFQIDFCGRSVGRCHADSSPLFVQKKRRAGELRPRPGSSSLKMILQAPEARVFTIFMVSASSVVSVS